MQRLVAVSPVCGQPAYASPAVAPRTAAAAAAPASRSFPVIFVRPCLCGWKNSAHVSPAEPRAPFVTNQRERDRLESIESLERLRFRRRAGVQPGLAFQ